MDASIVIVLTILAATVVFLVFEIVRIDVVAILYMLALGWAGMLQPQEMLSGFSSNAVIAMMGVMIMGRGPSLRLKSAGACQSIDHFEDLLALGSMHAPDYHGRVGHKPKCKQNANVGH